MAISIVQIVKSNTATTTIAPTGAGNTLIVTVASFGSTGAPSISSIKLGTTSLTSVVSEVNTGGSVWTAAYLRQLSSIAAGQTSVVISATNLGITSGNGGVCIYEVSGLTASPVDKINSADGTTAAWTITSNTLSQIGELVISMADVFESSAPSTPWINNSDAGTSWYSGYQIVSATTPLIYSGTQSSANPWAAVIVSFEAAATVTPVVSTLPVLAAPIAPGFIFPANFMYQPFIDTGASGLDQGAGIPVTDTGSAGFIPVPTPLIPPGFVSPASFTYQPLTLDSYVPPATVITGITSTVVITANPGTVSIGNENSVPPLVQYPPGYLSPAAFQFMPQLQTYVNDDAVSIAGVTANVKVTANSGSVAVGNEDSVPPFVLYPPGFLSPASFNYQPLILQTDITAVYVNGVTANVNVTANPGSVVISNTVSIPPTSLYPPGYISPAAFRFMPQRSVTANDAPVSITGSTANITVTANAGNVSTGNEQFVVPALMPPGFLSPAAFRQIPQISSVSNDDSVSVRGVTATIAVTANAGSVSLGNDNSVPPVLSPPGFISPAAFRHMPRMPVTSNDDAVSVTGSTSAVLVSANTGSIPVTLAGVSANINVSASSGSVSVGNEDSVSYALSPPGFISPAAFRYKAQIPVYTNDETTLIQGVTSRIVVTAQTGSVSSAITGVTASITITANPGSIPVSLTGATASIVVTARIGSIPSDVTGITSNINVQANSGSVTYPASVAGVTASIIIQANPGVVTFPKNIIGITSLISIQAYPGSVQSIVAGVTARVTVTANPGIAGGSDIIVRIPNDRWRARLRNDSYGNIENTWYGSIRRV